MKPNMGTTDRIIRTIAGILAMTAGLYLQSWWGLVGVVLLITAATRFCMPYELLGINTCDKKSDEKKHAMHPPP